MQSKDSLIKLIVNGVKQAQNDIDPATGRFLAENGGRRITNQHPENPYYHDQAILDLAVASGDGLTKAQKPDGQW